jgi:hypothetical protein
MFVTWLHKSQPTAKSSLCIKKPRPLLWSQLDQITHDIQNSEAP